MRVAADRTKFDLGAVPSCGASRRRTHGSWGRSSSSSTRDGSDVMPNGYGVSRGGKPLTSEQRVVDALPAPGEDGAALAAAATRAVQRLAAQSGVRVEIPVASSGDNSTSDRIVIAAIAGGLVRSFSPPSRRGGCWRVGSATYGRSAFAPMLPPIGSRSVGEREPTKEESWLFELRSTVSEDRPSRVPCGARARPRHRVGGAERPHGPGDARPPAPARHRVRAVSGNDRARRRPIVVDGVEIPVFAEPDPRRCRGPS